MDLLVINTSTEIVDTYQSSAGTSAVHQDFGLTPIQREEDVGANDWVIVSSSQSNRVRVALGVVVRIVLPLFNGVSRSLQGIRAISFLEVLRNVRYSRQLLANLVAYTANRISLNLSTAEVGHRFDPLLKMIKLRRAPAKPLEQTIILNTTNNITYLNNNEISIPSPMIPKIISRQSSVASEPPEKCVTLNVLAEPPAGSPIRADVIFIHGLHGSVINTWKQGLWNSEGRRVDIERPPRPPVRPPKRHRRSRTTLFDPPHRSKRPKIINPDAPSLPAGRDSPNDSDSNRSSESPNSFYSTLDEICPIDYSYECDDSDVTMAEDSCSRTDEYLTELEHHLPTFRLRDEDEQVPEDEEDEIRRSTDRTRSEGVKGEDYSRCWPGDWLPLDCPGVRVIAVNYTTDPYLWRPLWVRKRNRTSLLERSREMMELLTEIGVGVGHPIVWVGHSKGGIFIKQIMVDAWESGMASVAPLWRSSRGCFFYSVPHRGSPLADFNLPLVRQSVELVEIKKNSPGVLELHRRFVALYRGGHLRVQIFSFVETALTLMSVLYLRIVGIDSADPGIGEVCGVHLDHREICKPRDRDCILYTKLTKMINRVS